MKRVRFGAKGLEKPGLIDSAGRIRDLSGVIADLTGEALSHESHTRIAALPEGRGTEGTLRRGLLHAARKSAAAPDVRGPKSPSSLPPHETLAARV